MKRTKFFVPIPILLTLLLSGCVFDPSEFYFEREELSRVVQVQLVDYENPAQKVLLGCPITWMTSNPSISRNSR